MKMRKVLTCLIAVAVFIALLSSASVTVSASGKEKVSLTVGKVTAKAGGTTTVELKIKGNDIAGFQGKLIYDQDKLTIEKIETTDLLPGMHLFDQDKTTGKYLNGAFVYANSKGTKMDGTVLKFTFKAAGKASGTLPLTLEDVKVLNANREEVANTTTAGEVTISGTAPDGDNNDDDDNQSGGNQGGGNQGGGNQGGGNQGGGNQGGGNQGGGNQGGGNQGDNVSGGASDSTASANISMGNPDTESDVISGQAADASQNESDPSSLPAGNNTLLIIIIALAVVVVIIIVVIVLVNRRKRNIIG